MLKGDEFAMADITGISNNTYNPYSVTLTNSTDSANDLQQNGSTNSLDSIASTPAYSLSGNLAAMDLGLLQDSSSQQSSQTTSSNVNTLVDSITSTPAYSLSGNLATTDLTLLQGLSSGPDDTLFYDQSNNLNFISSSTFKNLVATTVAKSQQTSQTTSSNTEQFNPVDPFANDASSQTASSSADQFNPVDPFANDASSQITSSNTNTTSNA